MQTEPRSRMLRYGAVEGAEVGDSEIAGEDALPEAVLEGGEGVGGWSKRGTEEAASCRQGAEGWSSLDRRMSALGTEDPTPADFINKRQRYVDVTIGSPDPPVRPSYSFTSPPLRSRLLFPLIGALWQRGIGWGFHQNESDSYHHINLPFLPKRDLLM